MLHKNGIGQEQKSSGFIPLFCAFGKFSLMQKSAIIPPTAEKQGLEGDLPEKRCSFFDKMPGWK